ncbi:MAG: glycoside hydrolase family 92 protein [Bacteroidetes bacterium CHB5]|nr:glycoside hydrolase family 92 protein [Bacteroidetes bacterium CHB5]
MRKLLFLLFIVSGQSVAQKQPVEYVNPLIGTHDSRWMQFPGPTRPFGMVKLSPDNQETGWKAGYEYDISNIAGFSHIHSWTMAGLLVMPTTGTLQIEPGKEQNPDGGYRSRFSHANERAEAGYYSVFLDDYKIKAELTTTLRTGFHRYTFPKSDSARILVDLLTPSEYGYEISYAEIKKVTATEIQGTCYQQALRKANFNEYVLHFVMRFSKPFESMNGWVEDKIFRNQDFITSGFEHRDIGTFLNFKTAEGEQILVQVGISLVSPEQARLNLETELNPFNWDFEKVVEDSKNEWNKILSTLQVESKNEELKTKFYTNMYRAYSGRSVWSDVNGKYVDMYEKVQQLANPLQPVYGSDGFWISFWNLNQLWSLATPEIANNWVVSFLEMYDKGGWIPRGPAGIEYSGIMVASHEISLMTNAYHKGIRNYDVEKMYQAITKLQTTQGGAHNAGGTVGNRNLNDYISLGFVPDDAGPVSNTLAYAYDDWTVAQMAKALRKEKDYKTFTKRAFNYKNVFDSSIGYMRRKNRDGTWAHFSPYGDVAWLGSGFVEGNSWQYTYFVPHDLSGLIQLMGQNEFNNRLEKGFEASAKHNFNSEHLGSNSLEGMGVLPVNHGNQPNMQAAYLFNYSQKPWLTQKWANEIMNKYYGSTPRNGWLGDEDEGQMGAWFVMSALGLFEMDGGASVKPIYEIGTPKFDKVTIKLDPKFYPGKTFTIEAKNVSEQNIYIQSATLNGKPLTKPWFYHDELVKGGSLILKMGPKPNEKWGSAPEAIPPSLSNQLTQSEIDHIMQYDRVKEELEEWNRAVKAYYYHRKEHFESLPDTPGEIIFLGNSITDGAEWFELFGGNPNIKNRGIGGDDTDGVLERLHEVTSSQPLKVFVMIGTNDLAYGKTVEHVVENQKKIITEIRRASPHTKIYMQSVLPVDDAIHFTRPNTSIAEINKQLKMYCAEAGVTYIDLVPVFSDENGKLAKAYSGDGLHVNGKGYVRWAELIKNFIEEK